jgi:hypothetical protein
VKSSPTKDRYKKDSIERRVFMQLFHNVFETDNRKCGDFCAEFTAGLFCPAGYLSRPMDEAGKRARR